MSKLPSQSNRRFIWAICAFLICVWLGSEAFSQTDDTAPNDAEQTEAPALEPLDRHLLIGDLLGIDYPAWDRTAAKTEGLLLRGVASPFALDRMRTELGDWREVFVDEMAENSARLNTVTNQIAALGAVPAEGETEAPTVTDRRIELIAQRDILAAPGLLATEAHARADGMIVEIETQLRDRQAATLRIRGISPLNLFYWPDAVGHLWQGVGAIVTETASSIVSARWSSENLGRIVLAFVALAAAAALFLRGQAWARGLVPTSGEGAGFVVREFFGTILQAILPLIGLTALIFGLSQLDVFGLRGEAILRQVPLTGSIIILAVWLGKQFFPEGIKYGPLNQPEMIRNQARRIAIILAWVAALWLPYEAFLDSGPENSTAVAFLNFPFIVVLSVLLFRFATLFRHRPDVDAGEDAGPGRTRSVIGRLAQGVAIAAPILAGLGFDAAAQAILFPAILTLGLLGVIVYLQSLSYLVYELIYGTETGRTKALVPVLIGFVLLVLAIPIIALIWGAQRNDLIEYWTRFTTGFTFGETQVSPSDFLTFIVIFCGGYFVTGFIKNALRTSLLPRTSLDLGAQDAIVAGVGYIGIFLASVFAITSAGIDLSSLAIVAGALSVGIGFGLQTIVSNFVSGIILLIERPISQGDWIEVGDRMGYVRDISVRATRIETFDRTDVIVPNADLISNQVINWTRGNLVGRLILKIGVAYGSDADRVAALLREIAEAHPMVVMTPPPAVLFMDFGADALHFEVRAILRDVNFVVAAQSEMNFEISRRFAAEGIEIPFAQRDIWLRNPEVLGQAAATETKPTPAAPKFDQTAQPDDISAEPDAGDTT